VFGEKDPYLTTFGEVLSTSNRKSPSKATRIFSAEIKWGARLTLPLTPKPPISGDTCQLQAFRMSERYPLAHVFVSQGTPSPYFYWSTKCLHENF